MLLACEQRRYKSNATGTKQNIFITQELTYNWRFTDLKWCGVFLLDRNEATQRVTKSATTEDPNGGIPCAWTVIFFLLTLTGRMEGSASRGGRRCWPHRPRASSPATCWLAAAAWGAAVGAQAAPRGQGADRPTGDVVAASRRDRGYWPRGLAAGAIRVAPGGNLGTHAGVLRSGDDIQRDRVGTERAQLHRGSDEGRAGALGARARHQGPPWL